MFLALGFRQVPQQPPQHSSPHIYLDSVVLVLALFVWLLADDTQHEALKKELDHHRIRLP